MKALYELIGTFFLVFTIGMVVLEPGLPPGFAPLAIGSVLAVMIFAGGHVSGAHYNPAVTVAVFARGKATAGELGVYWGAQVAGAIVAGLLVLFMKGKGATPAALDVTRAIVAEFLFTFALCYVVLNVATAKGTSGNSFYGLAIGFTVMAGAFAVGGVSGAVFNPAVTIGAALMGMLGWGTIVVYFIAQFVAAYAAAMVFKAAHPGE
jgi:aquaporin Z